MRKWNAIVVDDQKGSIDHLVTLFKKIEYVAIEASFQDPFKALKYLRVNQVDLIILDVEMGEMSGFEFMKALPRIKAKIILNTAHQHYEDPGYDVNVVDVILKPVSQTRLQVALRRLDDELRLAFPEINDDESLDHSYDFFQIKGPHRFAKKALWFKNIIYIETSRGKVLIHQIDQKEPLLANSSIAKVLEILPRKWFKQCHQGYVFNINFFHSYAKNLVSLKYVDKKLDVGDLNIYPGFRDFVHNNVV